MDTRTKEIMDDFINHKLDTNDSFQFHCTKCGKCCIDRDDILLSALDLFRISKYLKHAPTDILHRYCEWYIGTDSRLPIVRLKPAGVFRCCPFLDGNKCMINDVKPAVCAMFPLGRAICFPVDDTKSLENLTVEYFFTNPGCGDDTRTQTVREWLNNAGISPKDNFFAEWTLFQMKLHKLLTEAEKIFDEAAMRHIHSPILGVLYLGYNLEEEFLPQFRSNTEKLLDGLRMILESNAA